MVGVFSLILSALLFMFWWILRSVGIALLWIPENLHTQLGVPKDTFVQAFNGMFVTQYPFEWQITIGGLRNLFLYASIIFIVVAVVSFAMSMKKKPVSTVQA